MVTLLMCVVWSFSLMRLARRSHNRWFIENLQESNLCFTWTTALKSMRQIPGLPVMRMKYLDCWIVCLAWMPLIHMDTILILVLWGVDIQSWSWVDNRGLLDIVWLVCFLLLGWWSRHPWLGVVSPSLGTVTVSGSFRMCCMSQNDWVSAGVQAMFSFPDLVKGGFLVKEVSGSS